MRKMEENTVKTAARAFLEADAEIIDVPLPKRARHPYHRMTMKAKMYRLEQTNDDIFIRLKLIQRRKLNVRETIYMFKDAMRPEGEVVLVTGSNDVFRLIQPKLKRLGTGTYCFFQKDKITPRFFLEFDTREELTRFVKYIVTWYNFDRCTFRVEGDKVKLQYNRYSDPRDFWPEPYSGLRQNKVPWFKRLFGGRKHG